MPLPSLPPSTFHHMANASAKDLRLTPIDAENLVEDYLGKLGEKLAVGTFEPSGSLHAIVFGEWGHGKSQVLYRTASFVEKNYPKLLCVRIIPETLTAQVILRQFESSIDANSQSESVFQQAFEKLGKNGTSIEAMELVAKTICKVSSLLEIQHTVLLFDEVQKMRRETFQCFLEELRNSFLSAERCVHTMQCHSMASLDDTRKLREELGDWMLNAERIQLPSIEMSNAYDFYRQRISDSGGDEHAQELIGQGLAKTLCEATGGNPRGMLQIANSVYTSALQKGVDELDAETVLEVFEDRQGPRPGTRLFDRSRLKRITEIIPQVLQPPKAKLMQTFLQKSFGELYVNRSAFSVTDLAERLDIDQTKLQWLMESVDGIKLFTAEEDPVFETTEYGISDDFRHRLGTGFDNSGSVSLKELQFSLILTPEKRQSDVADGLAKGLRFSRFAIGHPVPVPIGNAGENEIRGYKFESSIHNSSLTCPVLVTAICGFEPSIDFLESLAELLRSRTIHRAFILFYHPDLEWSQWIEKPEVDEILCNYLGDQNNPRVIGLTEEDWGQTSGNTDAEDSNVRFAAFFAQVAGLNLIFENETDENQNFAVLLNSVFEEKQITPDELCYLPTDEERKLLDSPSWSSEWKMGASRSKINQTLDTNYSKTQLSRLVSQFLSIEGQRYIRTNVESSILATSVMDILKSARNKLKQDPISRRVGEIALIPSSTESLEACVIWALNSLEKEGHISQDLLGYELLDLKKELRALKKEVKSIVKSAKTSISKLEKISDSNWDLVLNRIQMLEDELKIHGPPKDIHANLTRVVSDLKKLTSEKIVGIESKIIEDRKKDAQHLEQKFSSLRDLWEKADPDLRVFLLTDNALSGMQSEIAKYNEAWQIERKNSESKLRAERQNLLGQIAEFEDRLRGDSLSGAPDERLAGVLASGKKFQVVQICVEKVAK